MNERQAMEYIEEIGKYGSVPGLSSIRELCRRLGNPQDLLRFVHIAGTNGKGSVSAYMDSVLREAGYRVGRYLSPTIFEYRERIQVNGRMISRTGLCRHLERVGKAAEEMAKEGLPHPTAFEVETALAFLYFLEKRCDIVVLEAGLGGSLDATNLVTTTVLSVLTSISRDHMVFLGETLGEIAANKAGIIKEKTPVVSIFQEPEAMQEIEKEAGKKESPLVTVLPEGIGKVRYGIEKQCFDYRQFKKLEITLAGQYQIENCALAVEALLQLSGRGYPVSEKALREGLKKTVWKGRFSVIAKKPLFIVDGAHNEDAAKKLADSIRFYFTNKKIIYIMGILKDKEYEKIIAQTVSYAKQIITVTAPDHKRAMPAYELAGIIKEYHSSVTAADSLEEAVEMSYLLAGQDSVILAFGSLSFLGQLMTMVENRHTIRRDSHGRSEEN